MRIIEIRALRGANYYSLSPVIYLRLDIEGLEYQPSDTIPGFLPNLEKMFPSLVEHHCSPGVRGGFFERVKKGTWAGHIAEHVAIELQCLAESEVTFGKTFTLSETGLYDLVFEYEDEEVGLAAGKYAVKIVERLFRKKPTYIPPIVNHLKEIRGKNILGPSTRAIAEEAKKRGIPVTRLNDESLLQLGLGANQKRIQATIADSTSVIGLDIATDKKITKNLLANAGLPVPRGITAMNLNDALKAAKSIGYPIAIKPLSGNHGRGITTNIRTPHTVEAAFNAAKKVSSTVLVEEHLDGTDYRFLIIGGKLTAAAKREPAVVIGDGSSSIEQLIEKVNRDPKRGEGHEKPLTRIKTDDEMKMLLAENNYKLKSVLPVNEKVYLKSAANLSAGGTAEDITDEVHPAIKTMTERAARIVGLDIMGIDMILNDHRAPISNGCGIIEVNAAPGFRMHTHPSKGKPRNVGKAVVDMLFPDGTESTIPIVAITGTNGKTTTARLITHSLSRLGNTVGMTSTDGIVINGEKIVEGDYSGPEGARIVLQDSSVDHAILEVARGGILRRGLGYEQSDIAVVTNISKDHLGEGDIDTLEAMARLKGTIVEVVKPSGYSILNADDKLVLGLKEKAGGEVILFSRNYDNPALRKHNEEGKPVVTVYKDSVIIQKNGELNIIAGIKEIPLTVNGIAEFNVENVLAAVSADYALGLSEEQIRESITSFSPSLTQSPGRVNIIDMGSFKVMIDYGHNVEAIRATGKMLPKLAEGRKIRTADGTGNRRSEDIIEYGEALAEFYDHTIVTDTHPKHREVGETAALVKKGLLRGGASEEDIEVIIDDNEAIERALQMASPGDIVVLQANDVDQLIEEVLAFKNLYAANKIMNEAHKIMVENPSPKPQKTGTAD